MTGVKYWWVVETMAGNDIAETQAFDTAAEAFADYIRTKRRGPAARIGLVRDDYRFGGVRAWAYASPVMLMPAEFDNGAKVPKRFVAEMEKAIRA